MPRKVIVIGGGPAGLIAAIAAAEKGSRVILIERNRQLGKKLLLTGQGRCNLTNNCPPGLFLENIVTNADFFRNSFHRFNNTDTIRFFEDLGLQTIAERGKRIFPRSGKAVEVLNVLKEKLLKLGVEIRPDFIKHIALGKNGFELTSETNSYQAEAVIVATGGKAFPGTGSDGKAFALIKSLGHSITPLRPALVPVIIKAGNLTQADGLTLKNINFTISDKLGKKVFERFGEIEITTDGLGGPLILTASSYLPDIKGFTVSIDLKPALSVEMLDKRLLKEISGNPKAKFEDLLEKLLPRKLIPVFISITGIDKDLSLNLITRENRRLLIDNLKNLRIELDKYHSFGKALVSAGGVDVREIDPRTMESRLIRNLYFAGEVIDLDGLTGGFNLQIAWTTGYVAGSSC